MGKVFDEIDDRLTGWIAAQQLFFVATAPSGDGGHVNCSPKGPIESLRVLGPRRVAYLDLVGSGAETIAHLRQNGRIVIMLCAFAGPAADPAAARPGADRDGRPIRSSTELAGQFQIRDAYATGPARRSIVVVDVERVADSCGYGVPLMEPVGDRPQQALWVERKLAQGGPGGDRGLPGRAQRPLDRRPARAGRVVPEATLYGPGQSRFARLLERREERRPDEAVTGAPRQAPDGDRGSGGRGRLRKRPRLRALPA